MKAKIIIIVMGLLIYGRISQAALVEVDLFSPGEWLLTRDTVTGLDWLDLDATTFRTINSLIDGTDGRDFLHADGFRFATALETQTLFIDAGVTFINLGFTSDSDMFQAVSNLMGCLGTDTVPAYQDGVQVAIALPGIVDVDGPLCGPGFHTIAQLTIGIPGSPFANESAAAINFTACFNNSASGTMEGKFLVRPVPEPATLLLFTLGGAFIASRRNRR